jgi:hypothetical protein
MPNRTNRVLTIVFAALLLINVAHLLIGFASIPRYYERVTTLTIEPYPMPAASYLTNEQAAQNAARHNMNLSQYAISQMVYHSLIVLLCVTVALLIVLRAGWNWFAWYSAFLLTFIAGFAFYDETFVARLLPLAVLEVGALFWPLVLLYFFLFPNGKPVPRRALWLLVPVLILHFVFQATAFFALLFPEMLPFAALDVIVGPFQIGITFVFLFILGCQVYRYLRVSTREERQQTKWFLFGFVAFLGLSAVSEALVELNPFADEVGLLIFIFIPLSIGIAILRYRLWDIDVIIRRTVTYALVTALLLIVFFGSVILLQLVFANIFPDLAESEVVTVISTLAIAALFVPVRNRIQNAIDKRFNRKKYDAQKILQKFGETVRDETDLDKLTSELVNVVQETMQPKSVSLWLKPTKSKKRNLM